jgi:hypothetical protein
MYRSAFLLLTLSLVVGCSQTSDSKVSMDDAAQKIGGEPRSDKADPSATDKAQSPAPPAAQVAGSGGASLVIYENDEKGELKTGTIEFKLTGVPDLEQRVRKLDWKRPKNGPEVILVHDGKNANSDSMHAAGSFGASSPDDRMEMSVSHVEPDGMHKTEYCKSIGSIDQMLDVLKSYYQDDGKWRTMVKWTE